MERALVSIFKHGKLVLAAFFVFLCLAAIIILSSPSSPLTVSIPGIGDSSRLAAAQLPHPLKRDEPISAHEVRRAFNPVGTAAYLFVQMGAYRAGPRTFAMVGLVSKPLHVYHDKPDFLCEWVPAGSTARSTPTTAPGHKILPDFGFSRVYTTVVVNCTFESGAGEDGSGGRLLLHASTGEGGDEIFTAMEEAPGAVSAATFAAAPKYDYVYCGAPLYGSVSPQWVREWMAYHVKLFGESSDKFHFVLRDVGGLHPGVREAVRPWLEMGLVTVEDIAGQERFDGAEYLHNHFLVLSDCLHRYRLAAKWIFFFDLDEFIRVEPEGTTLREVVDQVAAEGYTQFFMRQLRMSDKLCRSADAGNTTRMWGIEKLVYKIDPKGADNHDIKHAVQPRHAFSAGVHWSQNIEGKSTDLTGMKGRINYYHYHGALGQSGDPCREFTDAKELAFQGKPYLLDQTLRHVAASVKKFERTTIGSRQSKSSDTDRF